MAFVVCFNFSTISPPPQGACGNVRLGGRISRQSFRVFSRAGFSDVVICREIAVRFQGVFRGLSGVLTGLSVFLGLAFCFGGSGLGASWFGVGHSKKEPLGFLWLHASPLESSSTIWRLNN